MGTILVVGSQWGDEGKGKIVDLLSDPNITTTYPDLEIQSPVSTAARFNGTNNAGHTVVINDKKYPVHLVPSAIFQPGVTCVIANGVMVNPIFLKEEVDRIKEWGFNITLDRLKVSNRAHILLPTHCALDAARETSRGLASIGTTKKGNGPVTAGKANRENLRMGQITEHDFNLQLTALVTEHNSLITFYGGNSVHVQQTVEQTYQALLALQPYVTDTSGVLKSACTGNRTLLLEAAQGMLLDIDHGTYPEVTSSNTTIGAAFIGTGLNLTDLAGSRVMGVVKAYTTRVGEGVFPTELKGESEELGNKIRKVGGEYGTTTGRARRCGWLDLFALQYAHERNGFTELALTKLDVLTGLPFINVCVGYELEGRLLTEYPATKSELHAVRPMYRSLNGWNTSLEGCTTYVSLPDNARAYVEFIQRYLQVPISLVSIGPERSQTIPVPKEIKMLARDG